jgi:hypothetical protein
MRGRRRALIGLAIAGLALGLAALALVTTSDRERDPTVWSVLALRDSTPAEGVLAVRRVRFAAVG